MKNNYALTVLLLISLIYSSPGKSESQPQISVLARIQTTGNSVSLIRQSEGDVIPSLLKNKELEKKIESLEPGDEALVKGYITYQATNMEGSTKLKPIFVIESINPVSLKRLGKVGHETEMVTSQIMANHKEYSPLSIPVTTEVASAMTLTTTVLLMQSLTANSSQPQVSQQLNTGLFIFAGALATGIFIYEQITHSQKGKNND